MTVRLDIQDGHRASRSIYGAEFTRIAHVYGLSEITGHQKIIYAMYDAGLPQIGAAYPDFPTAFLRSQEAEAIDPDIIKVTLHYAETMSSDTVIRISGSLFTAETNKDKDGNLIKVKYKFPSDYKLDTSLANQQIEKAPMLPKDVPVVYLTVSRSEINHHQYLMMLAAEYVGALNSALWAVCPNAGPRTWMMTGLDADSNNNGLSYSTTYSFVYKNPLEFRGPDYIQDSFDFDVTFRDERTSEPPSDIKAYIADDDTANTPWGLKRNVKVIREKNFNDLFLA